MPAASEPAIARAPQDELHEPFEIRPVCRRLRVRLGKDPQVEPENRAVGLFQRHAEGTDSRRHLDQRAEGVRGRNRGPEIGLITANRGE